MAISFTRYIEITSGIGGNSPTKNRDLITRIFTTNPMLPPKSFLEVEEPDETGAYFGITSEEFFRSQPYFGFVSKQLTSAQKLSFARWVPDAVAPIIYGDPDSTGTLAQFNALTSGSFSVTLNGATANLTGLNLSTDGSLVAVAAAITTALQAVTGFTGVILSYGIFPNLESGFMLSEATTGSAAGEFSFPASSPTINALLGFTSVNTINSPGEDAETLTQTLTNSVMASNNFATFLFTNGSNISATSTAQAVEIAKWNASNNINFLFLCPVTSANAAEFSAALLPIQGTVLTFEPDAGTQVGSTTEFAEMLPGKVAAATDYTQRNAVQNYMFQMDDTLAPSVTDDNDADIYDGLLINYYGQTQEFGQPINFYQRGVVTPGTTGPADIGVAINEIWLKSTIGSNLMNLILSLGNIQANNQGRGQIIAVIQAGVTLALTNGVISVGNQLSVTQQQFIQSISGSLTAAAQVQTVGYWFNVSFTSTVDNNGVTSWQANYILIYAKNNVIRSVKGSHSLI